MTADRLAGYAGLFADRSRAAICLALIDGRAWTSGEIARHVRIAPSTASEHLTALVDAGVLVEQRQGRHRYLRLAGPEVAQLVEDLSAFGGSERPVGLRQVRASQRLAAGRTCYDHLAGDLGVAIRTAFVDRGLLADTGVTDAGRVWFEDLLGAEALRRKGSRPLVRECLDWTRRVPHLGGALGAAMCAHLFDRRWIIRPRADRAVELTADGRQELHSRLGIRSGSTM